MKAALEKLCIGVWIMALSALCAAAALAAEAPATYPIHIQDALQTVIVAVFAAASAAVTWIVGLFLGRLAKLLKVQIRGEVNAAVEAALREGLVYARDLALAQALKIENPRVRSEVVADAANYVLERFPKLVREAKLDRDRLVTLASAKLPIAQEAAHEPGNAG